MKAKPVALSLYFGIPGAGKSTFAAYLAKRDMKKGRKVWSNFGITGAYKCEKSDFGKYMMSDGRLIIDEAGLEYDNRKMAMTSDEIYFFKYHRHYQLDVDFFSQGLDVDIKIRKLARHIYLIKPSLLPFFIKRKEIGRRVGINDMTKEICDEYFFVPFLTGGTKLIFCPPLWKLFNTLARKPLPEDVAQQIKHGISIDVIVNQRKRAQQWTVSTTTLYRYIDRGYIPGITNKHLPEKPRRKSRKSGKVKATRAPKGLPIDRRPVYINLRLSFGHWEMDSVIGTAEGKRQSLLVLTERLTRFEIIFRASSKTAAATTKALDGIIPQFPHGTFQTITVDNGSEFQDCHGMEHDRHGNKRLTVYYCHPYSSCERGSNERNNRIIRRYFPKGKSMAKVTQKDCDKVAALINSMPRKILNYETAADLFNRYIANLAENQP